MRVASVLLGYSSVAEEGVFETVRWMEAPLIDGGIQMDALTHSVLAMINTHGLRISRKYA